MFDKKGEIIMWGKFLSVMNSVFSTAGITGCCIMILTAVTKMDFVDIGVVSAIVGSYVGVTSFIRWEKAPASTGNK